MTDILEYQASEAKAKWAELLDEVERGRTVRITRHGKTIARVVPEKDRRAAEIAEAIERLKALRRTLARRRSTKSWRAATRDTNIELWSSTLDSGRMVASTRNPIQERGSRSSTRSRASRRWLQSSSIMRSATRFVVSERRELHQPKRCRRRSFADLGVVAHSIGACWRPTRRLMALARKTKAYRLRRRLSGARQARGARPWRPSIATSEKAAIAEGVALFGA